MTTAERLAAGISGARPDGGDPWPAGAFAGLRRVTPEEAGRRAEEWRHRQHPKDTLGRYRRCADGCDICEGRA